MRGRSAVMGETTVRYKRLPSREPMDRPDQEVGLPVSAFSQMDVDMDQEPPNPSWKLSLPHVCVAIIAAFLFGYHLAVVNAPLEYIAFDLGFSGNPLAEGLLVSMCLVGAFFGCSISGWIADGLGRRRAFQASAVPMILGALFSAMSTNSHAMFLGRLIVGFGMGIAGPVTSLYITEISPAHVRGTYGSLIQIATCLGILGALFIGIPANSIPGWWRACFWISSIPAALLALGMELCAESPQWLVKQSKWAEAEYEYERLWGGANVKFAMAEISRLDKGDEIEHITFMDLLSKRYWKVVSTGAGLFALQQLSGINSVFYFSSTIFKSAGIHPDLANVCVGVANLTASIIATFLMDKLGRKSLLLLSFFGMGVAMAAQTAGASLSGSSFARVVLSVGGTLLFVFMFAIGAGPVPGLLLPEIFNSRIRAKAMAFCMCVHWVVNCFVGLMFLELLKQLGAQVLYTFFGFMCMAAVVFISRNVMETKGKSLEEIEIALLSGQ
uniref:Major facilitator superfamily (MFS) profile domain-containing protein n=1 Tax=Araucaria cunninghamii TaxID=56994 RepID=A0A0D6QUC2_ARACU